MICALTSPPGDADAGSDVHPVEGLPIQPCEVRRHYTTLNLGVFICKMGGDSQFRLKVGLL